MWTQEILCVLNWCVNTTLFDWCTCRFLCVDAGFSCVRLCQEFLFYFFNKNMFFDIKSKVCTMIFYTM